MFELLDLDANYKRGKAEPTELCAAVESWGGTVVEHRQISRLTRSPFCGLRVFPIVYEIRANHAGRRGYWYVRTSSDGAAPDWAWLDLDGYDSLPIEHQTALIACNAEVVSRLDHRWRHNTFWGRNLHRDRSRTRLGLEKPASSLDNRTWAQASQGHEASPCQPLTSFP